MEGRKERREKGKEGGRWAVNAQCSQKGCLFKEERKEKKKKRKTRFGGLGRKLRKSFPDDLSF